MWQDAYIPCGQVRGLLDGMLSQQGIARGHLLCQSVGFKYQIDRKKNAVTLVEPRVNPDAAGRRYWTKQLGRPAAEGMYMAAQLAMSHPGFAEPDCAFLHEAYCIR